MPVAGADGLAHRGGNLAVGDEVRAKAKARRLLTTGGASVTAAAFDVGYESPSQFSREYARKFGVSPSQDVAPVG